MIVFCPLCKEELVKPKHPKKDHQFKFLHPSKCKNNHEFMVSIVAGHLSIEGSYYQSPASTTEREKRRVELLDGGVCI